MVFEGDDKKNKKNRVGEEKPTHVNVNVFVWQAEMWLRVFEQKSRVGKGAKHEKKLNIDTEISFRPHIFHSDFCLGLCFVYIL